MNNKGQSILEASIALPLVILLCKVCFLFIYLGSAKFWVSFQAKETAYCLLTHQKASHCKSRFETSLSSIFGNFPVEYTNIKISMEKVNFSGLWNHWLQIKFEESYELLHQ